MDLPPPTNPIPLDPAAQTPAGRPDRTEPGSQARAEPWAQARTGFRAERSEEAPGRNPPKPPASTPTPPPNRSPVHPPDFPLVSAVHRQVVLAAEPTPVTALTMVPPPAPAPAAIPTPTIPPALSTPPAAVPPPLTLPAATPGAAAAGIRARVAAFAAAGAWDQLTDLLLATRPLPLRIRLSAVWIPLVEAFAARAAAVSSAEGRPDPGTGSIFRTDINARELATTLRADLRLALAAFEDTAPELWLVPAAPADESAAYLGALILSLRGHPARPWIWRVAPPGLAVVITAVGPAPMSLGAFGSTTLAELCRQNGFM